jgi:hypothetical protein
MPRNDICNYLIHFTKNDPSSGNPAFEVLQTIISSGFLLGSNNLIRGSYKCICFSEVPLEQMPSGLVNPDYYSRYSPFGIMVSKKWLYDQGGRPVIYEHDSEFELLPETHRWRHVRYEPGVVDFTWEREWRVRTERLAHSLYELHDEMVRQDIADYSTVFDEEEARMMFDRSFEWQILTLL